MSKPKITILPPVEQDVFFQDTQFDSELPGRGGAEGMVSSAGRGTDPVRYCLGLYPDHKSQKAPLYGRKALDTKLKNAEKELDGHDNKEAILKILRSGL